MDSVAKFVASIIKIALVLGVLGTLRDATLSMANRAANAQQGMISYSKFTKMLTAPYEKRKAQVH